jgi:hypothetical protein
LNTIMRGAIQARATKRIRRHPLAFIVQLRKRLALEATPALA